MDETGVSNLGLTRRQHHQAGAVQEAAAAAIFVSAFASSIAGFAFSAICGALLFHMIDDPLRVVQTPPRRR
jgi:hypothetical protein